MAVRWVTMQDIADAGLTLDRSICILDKDGPQYSDLDWIISRLQAMPASPMPFSVQTVRFPCG